MLVPWLAKAELGLAQRAANLTADDLHDTRPTRRAGTPVRGCLASRGISAKSQYFPLTGKANQKCDPPLGHRACQISYSLGSLSEWLAIRLSTWRTAYPGNGWIVGNFHLEHFRKTVRLTEQKPGFMCRQQRRRIRGNAAYDNPAISRF
jgi:hypothetical protein